jgi:hypothetical protein
MASKDSSNVKADGFPRGEDDMANNSKRPKTVISVQAEEVMKPISRGVCVDYDPVEDVASRTRIYDDDGKMTYDSLEDCNPQEIPHPEISPLTKEEESIAETMPRFRPRDCVQCTARRPTRSSYSRVYCTKGNTRYIRCGWKPCGYRYKQVEE